VQAVGEVSTFLFTAYYLVQLFADDCIESELFVDLIAVDYQNLGCGTAGGIAFDFLLAEIVSGRYDLDVRSTVSGVSLYQASWNVPSLTFSATVSSTAATTGETVGVVSTFGLGLGGPDGYVRRGTLTVDGGTPISTPLVVEIYSPAYLAFFGLTPTSDYETFTTTTSISFGSVGTKSVSIGFDDLLFASSTTASMTVTDPALAQIADLREQLNRSTARVVQLESSGTAISGLLAIAALIVAVLAIVLGLVALRASRRGPPGPPTPTVVPTIPQAPIQPIAPSPPPAWPPEGPPPPPSGPP
jgi:hypothetical protein